LRHALAAALARRDVDKEYLAIAKGTPHASHFLEQGPIGDLTGSTIRIKKWVVPDGQPALTTFEVLDTKAGHCLLLARPKTGRTNQIRIHAAVNHLPLVGDKLYHVNEQVFDSYFLNRGNTPWIIEQTGFHRLCLHAHRLGFFHPETGKRCDIECPMPQDMSELWQSYSDSPS